ncbi:TonB-dependent receptor [Halieaceae bacterium IMCC14734]|uniref:TonB-dependent receptor n=1 Tax=Candidatus Litorirhabdus singularis TaxID=2518993 RepID=A0ABT3TK06_9GAMM|nr:TonB-dependent receptor [Candidatus Litorirhabdus singularis]MCX2982354.1 TonB-dependent receptor [Candidatus Litorirhabdus singularis]
MKASIRPFLTLSCLSVSLATGDVGANELPEIVVTAQFRDTNLMQEANSTSVIGAELIQQRAAQHLDEVINLAPNVNFSGGSNRARFFQVRGVGDRSQFQAPLNPSVGVILDGVDFSGMGGLGTLFDIEQVEILRGPQGTLHGANALAGLINIRSAAPTAEFENYIEAGIADYQTWNLGAASSGPLGDSLLYRVAAHQFRSDGFTDNQFLQREDTQSRDELTLRGKLRWLADAHTVDLGLNHIDINNGYDGFSLDNVRDTLSDEPGQDDQKSSSASVLVASTFNAFDNEVLLTVANTRSDYGYDEDWVYEGFHPFGYSSFDRYQRERDSYSAQWRLHSNDSSKLFANSTDWTAGAYYLSNDEDLNRFNSYGNTRFDSRYETATLALFGQLDISFTEALKLTLGLRWEDRDTDYKDSSQVNSDTEKSLWGGRIALEYQTNDQTLAYASIARGYRANGVNPDILSTLNEISDPEVLNLLSGVSEYDEESLINYEVGLKARLLENRLETRLAMFYMDREDQQVRGSFVVQRPGGSSDFIDFTDNAAQGNNYGMELEVDWLLSDALRLWGSLGLLETEYEDYINAQGDDLAGREQAQAPAYQYTLGARYSFSGGLYLQADLEGKDSFYFSDRHEVRASAYDLLNASVGYQARNWTLTLWGRNLTDEDIFVRGFGGFGNDPRKDYAVEPYYQYGAPRQVGLSASYTF